MLTGDFQQAQVRRDEEGVRAECAVRLRDRTHHLQQQQQAVPVRVDRHGQGAAQVHRVQRASRESHQQEHHRGNQRSALVLLFHFKIFIQNITTRGKLASSLEGGGS